MSDDPEEPRSFLQWLSDEGQYEDNYRARLAAEAELGRLQECARRLVGAAKAWRDMSLICPIPEDRSRVVNAFADAIDAFDPMLSETTEALDGGKAVGDDPGLTAKPPLTPLEVEVMRLQEILSVTHLTVALSSTAHKIAEIEELPELVRTVVVERDHLRGIVTQTFFDSLTGEMGEVVDSRDITTKHRFTMEPADWVFLTADEVEAIKVAGVEWKGHK